MRACAMAGPNGSAAARPVFVGWGRFDVQLFHAVRMPVFFIVTGFLLVMQLGNPVDVSLCAIICCGWRAARDLARRC